MIAEPPVKHLQFDFAGVDYCAVQELPHCLYLVKLEVAPLFQGQGIGSRVLRELKRRGRPIRLTACPDNPEKWSDLLRFYARNGFYEEEGSNEMVWTP